MAFINHSNKEINCKIIYCGPQGGGRSANLNFIYKKIHGGSKDTLPTLNTDSERTLFFKFLPLSMGEVKGFKTRFHLYTVPGEFFDSSKKMIFKGVDGIVFVADSRIEKLESNVRNLENLKATLQEHGYTLSQIPIVFQYNKRDLPNISSTAELRNLLNTESHDDFDAVAVNGKGVFETLKCITKHVLENLKEDK